LNFATFSPTNEHHQHKQVLDVGHAAVIIIQMAVAELKLMARKVGGSERRKGPKFICQRATILYCRM